MGSTEENLSNREDEMFTRELHGFFGVLTKLLGELGVGCPLAKALVRAGYDGTVQFSEPASSLTGAATDSGVRPREIDARKPGSSSITPNVISTSQRSIAISSLSSLTSTLLHNLTRECSSDAHFQRVVWTEELPEVRKLAFHEFVVGRSAELLAALDDRLAADEADAGSKDAATNMRAGVGIYYFEGRPSASLSQNDSP